VRSDVIACLLPLADELNVDAFGFLLMHPVVSFLLAAEGHLRDDLAVHDLLRDRLRPFEPHLRIGQLDFPSTGDVRHGDGRGFVHMIADDAEPRVEDGELLRDYAREA
jgi:hypothetical protein